MLFDSFLFFLLQLKCSGIQLIVCSLLGDQIFVVTTLDDTSVIQNHDGLTVSDSRQTVRNDEYGPALHQIVHTLLYQCLGTGMAGGSATAARAMEISWRCPWERLAPFPVSMVL